jgi:AcrR family transcriptional regulator
MDIPTRQRLLDEALRLFAERGYTGTSVGDIESAAGLQPRRGALYNHFPSKQALLEAAVRAHLDRAALGAADIVEMDLGELMADDGTARREVLAGLGRWFLVEMDRLEDLTRIIENDGGRLPELTVEVKRSMVDLSYRVGASLISALDPGSTDPEATAVILLGALVALRRTTWTFGSSPLGISDDRVIGAWVDLVLARPTDA